MDKFVCVGNVRKGSSIKQARAIFHLPDSVVLIFGQPQDPEGKARALSMFWGVWVPEEQCCDAETGEIIPRQKIFWQGIVVLILLMLFLPQLFFRATNLNAEGSGFIAMIISVPVYFILRWRKNKSSSLKMAK